jgi:hypothetical protein
MPPGQQCCCGRPTNLLGPFLRSKMAGDGWSLVRLASSSSLPSQLFPAIFRHRSGVFHSGRTVGLTHWPSTHKLRIYAWGSAMQSIAAALRTNKVCVLPHPLALQQMRCISATSCWVEVCGALTSQTDLTKLELHYASGLSHSAHLHEASGFKVYLKGALSQSSDCDCCCTLQAFLWCQVLPGGCPGHERRLHVDRCGQNLITWRQVQVRSCAMRDVAACVV